MLSEYCECTEFSALTPMVKDGRLKERLREGISSLIGVAALPEAFAPMPDVPNRVAIPAGAEADMCCPIP